VDVLAQATRDAEAGADAATGASGLPNGALVGSRWRVGCQSERPQSAWHTRTHTLTPCVTHPHRQHSTPPTHALQARCRRRATRLQSSEQHGRVTKT
jgi:hypothetical protein